MRVRTMLIRGALTAALLAGTLGIAAGSKDKEPAPHFSATTTTGEKFNNESIKGKVVLLEFWTTWCGFCADEAAFVDRVGKELAPKGLILLAIDVGESKKKVRKYLEQHPRDCKIVMMEDTNLDDFAVARMLLEVFPYLFLGFARSEEHTSELQSLTNLV